MQTVIEFFLGDAPTGVDPEAYHVIYACFRFLIGIMLFGFLLDLFRGIRKMF